MNFSPLISKREHISRLLIQCLVVAAGVYLVSRYLQYWHGWPSELALLAQWGVPGLKMPKNPLEGALLHQALALLAIWCLAALMIGWRSHRTRRVPLTKDAQAYEALAAYIARAAFWSVLFIGLADTLISILRVENLLEMVVGSQWAQELGRPNARGLQVHYPLIVLALLVALCTRGLGFVWLALLVVVAEFQIVIARFVFSYEQAFMGDLVRFWYAALFVFASAYTLLKEGHVRVDVFYTNFRDKTKAACNALGSLLFGIPICWVILVSGLGSKRSIISSPLLSFEISQSGYGLYVKYLMAGFLLVFALSMLCQFSSLFLRSIAKLHQDQATRRSAT